VRVLQLVHNYYPSIGGSQLLFQKIAEGFVDRFADEVTVFTTNALRNPSFLVERERLPIGDEIVNGVMVRRFPFWRKTRPILKQVMRLARRMHAPFREYLEPICLGPISPLMFTETRRANADVIACMAFPFLNMYYGFATDRPVVLFGALHLRGDHVPRPVLRAIDRASAYIAFTDYERDVLVRNGSPRDRIHVVGLGADVPRFARADGSAIRARFGIGDAPVVAFVGRQASHKGCDTLVRAMAEVWKTRPEAYLVIAGSRTAFSTTIDRLVADLPAAQRARVIIENDFTEQAKPQWFAACDVFVSVSTDESFGISFVEAWACGKPVIGGRIGAVECLIRDGEDGLLVPCGDARSLAASIERLLGDDVFARRLGAAGYQKVMAQHDWPSVVDKLHAIYARVSA
jgi:glycosyltransferase involved in cell wall biosynthesis